MGLFIEGIGFGLILSVMLGPIFLVLTQSSLKEGVSAGITVASGVWVSDMIFITCSYLFVSQLDKFVNDEAFTFWSSISGGIILLSFGLVTLLKKSTIHKEDFNKKLNLKTLSSFFTKGFLVNTVNPFTFVFWIGVMTSYVIGRDLNLNETLFFVAGIFLTIVSTDLLKVLLADVIRKRMNDNFFRIFSKIAGCGLMGFGLYLFYYAFST